MNKIIVELNIIFKIYNKIIKFDIEFHNFNFEIRVKNKKKSFEFFYIRFNATITSLNYLNILKIFNLKRLINIRLKYRILNKNFNIFRDFVTRLRYIIINFEIINKKISNKENKTRNI